MHRERLVGDDLLQPAVGLVLDAHAALFLDDLALGLEDLLVDPQRRHAIGLEPEHQRQVLRRHRLPEHRRVFVGVALLWPPTLEMYDGCPSGSTFFEPLNIMCSNRCAKPVRPGFSFFEPTWYQISRCTIGVE